jgi:hypothetical protein
VKWLIFLVTLTTGLWAQTTIFGVRVGQSPDTIPRCAEPESDQPKDQPCISAAHGDKYGDGDPGGSIDFDDRGITFETLDGKIEFMKYEWEISESESVLNRLRRKFGPATLHRVALVNRLGIKSTGVWAVWYRKDAEVVFNAPYLATDMWIETCAVLVKSHKWVRHEAETHKETQF